MLLCIAQGCDLVLLSAAGKSIYSSSTGEVGTACMLTVSSLGGGFISVSGANSTVLYLQPSAFQILLDGQTFNRTSTYPGGPSSQIILPGLNQNYDLVTGAVTLAASLPPQVYTTARTLLPTINAILGTGFGGTTPDASSNTNTFLYNIAAQSWSQTGSLAVPRYGGVDLVTLHDGSALAVGGLFTRACETYSPSTGVWTLTGSLAVDRARFETALLLSGQVLSQETAPQPDLPAIGWVLEGCSCRRSSDDLKLRNAAGTDGGRV